MAQECYKSDCKYHSKDEPICYQNECKEPKHLQAWLDHCLEQCHEHMFKMEGHWYAK